ncbi:MAG: toxin of the YafQ-DinJ toxin-antitoxin system [Parcubacteria group bacterium]|nr:toxin of the YafQ-DinJ toxin-antitoxin system [Parcubacteria group bacterium]
MRFNPSKRFEKQYAKLSVRTQDKITEKLNLFVKNQSDPVLENHMLKGKYKGYRSINITGDLRLIYEQTSPDSVWLLLVGTHHELYGS